MQGQEAFLHVLNEVSFGGILVDAAGAVLRTNPRAEELLLPCDDESDRRSGDQVATVMRNCFGELTAVAPRTCCIQLPTGSPGIAKIIPMHPPIGDATAVIVLRDLTPHKQPSVCTVMQALELTKAEAQLAIQIGSGESLRAISGRQGKSFETLRSQLKQILAKTHTNRQAKLAVLVNILSFFG